MTLRVRTDSWAMRAVARRTAEMRCTNVTVAMLLDIVRWLVACSPINHYGGETMPMQPDDDQVTALLTGIREALDEIVRILRVHEAAHVHRAEEDAHLLGVLYRKHGKHLWDMTLQQRRIAIAGLNVDRRPPRGRLARTNGTAPADHAEVGDD